MTAALSSSSKSILTTTDWMHEGWDRTFFRASSLLAEPVCKAFELLRFRLIAPLDPQTFDNYSTMGEIAYRGSIVAGAIFAICAFLTYPLPLFFSALLIGASIKVLRAIAVALQSDGFTYIRGDAAEKTAGSEVKVMTWNICGIGGGMHYDHGGVISWRSRLDRIVQTIQREKPDVLILQEIYDTELAEALRKKLGSQYVHFFTHLGPNVWGSEGGLMVATKNALCNFTHTSFVNNDWTLNRGFATFELQNSRGQPYLRIVGTHLIHGTNNEKRKVQIEQIHQAIQELPHLPTVIAGDLNIERDEEGREILSPLLIHGYLGQQPTCTNRLVEQWYETTKGAPDETIDYISLFKKHAGQTRIKDCKTLEDGFNPKTFDTRTALSDHQPLIACIRGL